MHVILSINKAVLLITGLIISMVFMSGQASAQEAEVTPNDQAEKVIEEFDTYTAVEGDSVTGLVRRSIIEYGQQNDGVELTNAQVVFTESNIVNDLMCGDLLHVGQEVSISRDKISAYSEMSQNLTTEETASWDIYAANVSFVLSDRTAAQTTTSDSSNPANGGEGSGEGSADEEVDDDSESSDDSEDEDNDSEDKNNSSLGWLWWVAGGAIVLGGWHRIGQQRK